MAAPKGNAFWKARSTHGRNPIFTTPEQLFDACLQYIQWVEDNPLQAVELVSYQGESRLEAVPKMRAMSIGGMCIFLDIATVTWREYAKRDGFSPVTTRVEDMLRAQKFEGAAAGFLNANIIARDLGLADKSELTGANGGPIETKDATDPREAARQIALFLRQQLEASSE